MLVVNAVTLFKDLFWRAKGSHFLAFLLLFAPAACAAPPSQAIHTPEPHLLPVAHWAVEVSDGSWNKHLAVDNDIETWWSAEDFAPQWIEVIYPADMMGVNVARVELTVSQVSPGPATHKVRVEDALGKLVAWHRFDSDLAKDGDIFILKFDPPVAASKVRILTTRHEGWVAYRELRVFGKVTLSLVTAGLSRPVYLSHAGDGSGRLFVLEQGGRIRIVKDGALLDEPFLDISSVTFGKRQQLGLLGIAFPQDYARTGRFYVSYTDFEGQNVLSRFRVSLDNPDRADPDSEERLISFPQLSEVHPIGTLAFGPRDGYLYVAVGDSHRSENSPPSQAAQDTSTLYGSILRLDVSPDTGYAIPPDNPFAGVRGHAPEIWSYGLRNPWGIAFDPDSGALFIPDAGHVSREEINYQPPGSVGGSNYGWRCWEGDVNTGECNAGHYIAPVFVYGRDAGCAIVGGAVSEGRFVYTDFCTDWIRSLARIPTGWEHTPIVQLKIPVSSIGADEVGNLYALGYWHGTIFRIRSEE